MKTLSFVLILLLLGNLNSCKDREIQPDDVPREYTLKGKLLNGTTMEPLYPGLWLNLKVSDMSALPSPKFETIGSCQIQQDGSFELQYPHNKLAQSLNASMRFESSFYISPPLPRNKNVDTILYESTWGSIQINIIDIEPFNMIYWAHKNESDSMIFGEIKPTYTNSHTFRYYKPGLNIFYDTIPIIYSKENDWISGHPPRKYIELTGDPFTDIVKIEY